MISKLDLTATDFDSNDQVPSRYTLGNSYFESLFAGLLLVPALPAIGLLAAIVRLTSRGPAIFKQVRVGKDGQVFTMYKIRTMRVDAEDGVGSVWSQNNDPRVTKVGRWIRRLHLDELPQLLNVVRGQMSLIGPRPERPDIAAVLGEKIIGYDARHSVKPGITGLAQINLPPDSDLASVRRKLHLDLVYMRTANRSLDLRIFLASGFRLVGLSGDRCIRLFRLDEQVPARWSDVGGAVSTVVSQDSAIGESGETGESGNRGFVQFDLLVEESSQQIPEDSQSATHQLAESLVDGKTKLMQHKTAQLVRSDVGSNSKASDSLGRETERGDGLDSKSKDLDEQFSTHGSAAPRPK